MSDEPTRPATRRERARSAQAGWQGLQREQRAVTVAAGLLLASMLLPWYSRTTHAITQTGVITTGLQTKQEGVMAITTFTFVEAAIFLVAVGVMYLMYARSQNRGFHLPGGDGNIVTLAGGWATFLVFYRFVDQPAGENGKGAAITTDYGLSWGIFFGLLAALFLAYCGQRLRQAHVAEPPLPRAVVVPEQPPVLEPTVRQRPRRPPPPVDGGEQLSFDEAD